MLIRPVAPHQGDGGSRGRGVGDEVVSVETFAAYGDEEIARLDLSRIPLDSSKDGVHRNCAAHHGAGADEDVLQCERGHQLAPLMRPPGSSARRSAARKTAERARGFASISIVSGRTARRVTFRRLGRWLQTQTGISGGQTHPALSRSMKRFTM